MDFAAKPNRISPKRETMVKEKLGETKHPSIKDGVWVADCTEAQSETSEVHVNRDKVVGTEERDEDS